MSSEKLAELFTRALELSGPELGAYLQGVAIDSPELHRELESLLSAHGEAGDFLQELDARQAASLVESVCRETVPDGDSVVGRRIGPYSILREIGRGGMGIVYFAERAEADFEQRVALKVIRGVFSSPAAHLRFVRERKILARLEHRGITRLLDGGVTADGDPYFAMEYIEGEPITTYSHRRGLSLEDRLRLFIELCWTVQFAHRNLIVHRDLKPSNILVTEDGETKLLDFGIAKLLAEGQEAMASLTRESDRALTPDYAAPEQLRGEPVTTSTDVFSLGRLLYELLTDARPAGVKPAVTGGGRELAFLPPSATVDPGRLKRQLVGDLDKVVLKALREEPERRYRSAEALAEDLQRYLDGMPVRARPDRLLYRASKFARRNWIAVSASLLVALSLGLGMAGTAWQARVAAGERDRARLESEKLQATQEYLIGLFSAADPVKALGEDPSARELIARGIERLEGELLDQPEVRLEMLETLGRVSVSLGDFELAEPAFQEALDLAIALHDDRHLRVASILVQIGGLHRSQAEWPEAEVALRRALAICGPPSIDNFRTVAAAQTYLGTALENQGEPEEGIAAKRRALETLRAFSPQDTGDLVALLSNLGTSLRKVGDYSGAEKALRESLEKARDFYGPEHPEVATIMVGYARVLVTRGDWREAEELYREGIAMDRRLRGDDHPRLAVKLHNFATFLHSMGDYQEASNLHRQVLESIAEKMGQSSPYYAMTLDSLASDLAQSGRFADAMPLFAQAEPLLLKALGPDHFYSITHFRRHAGALHLQGKNQVALPLIERSVRQARASNQRDLVSRARIVRGWVRLDMGALEEAEQDFLAALDHLKNSEQPSLFQEAEAVTGLGWTLIADGKFQRAAELLDEALFGIGDRLPRGHWLRAELRAAAGAASLSGRRREEGRALLQEAHARLETLRGFHHPATRRVARYLKP
ncbi:MAG: serine/threonine-protein kinase [Deltaproteobacteria bacterium]|nr:serine/threonine-protein kinase [Deltaproteobacteria bacterium]